MSTQRQPARGPMHGGPMGGMGGPGGKAKDAKGTLKRLVGYLRPQKAKLICVALLALFSVGGTIAGPKILAGATNELFRGVIGKQVGQGVRAAKPGITDEQLAALGREDAVAILEQAPAGDQTAQISDMLHSVDFIPGKGIDFAAVGGVLAWALAVYLLGSAFAWGQHFIMARVSERTMYRIRSDADAKIAKLPLKYFDGTTRGEILSRITNDVDNIARTLSQNLTQLVTAVLTILGVLGMMISISLPFALISLLVLPACLFTAMGIAKRSKTHFSAQWKSTGALNGHIEEMYTGQSLLAVFNRQEEAIAVFDAENKTLEKSSFKAQFISGIIMPAMNLISNLNFVAICVLGGLRVASGTMSLGDVQAFIQYARQFTQPITQTSSIMNILQSTLASAERVFELLDETEEPPDAQAPENLSDIHGRVEFRDVSFSYTQEPLIEHMNLTVLPGQTVAIVGPTGAGKTTLVNLLLRFYDLNGGGIFIDGVDIRSMTRDSLRGHFGMVLQDAWQFTGTIYENIAYGRDGADAMEVYAAAKAAYVDHFVRTLPEGYGTVLEDDASNISQGQRQLLTIARAFVANPQVLILDEATSSVDTRTEVLIQNAMNRLMKRRTAFVIAHRLSTIRGADTILFMHKGSIVEQGSHDELIAKKGYYYDLYQSQFENAQGELR